MAISILFYCMVGALTAFGIGLPDNFITFLAIIYACIFITSFAEILLHELGHLIFGFLSGYRFGCFGIGRHVWLRREGKIVHRNYTMPGAAGHCMMVVPKVDAPPAGLFYFGGALMDMLSCLLFGFLFFRTRESLPLLAYYFLYHAAFALYTAFNNAIPRLIPIDNDGCRYRGLRESAAARRAYMLSGCISEALCLEDTRLRDMPEEWFPLPSEADLGNTSFASASILHAGRLMDEHRFGESQAEILRLLDADAALSTYQRLYLIADWVSMELVSGNHSELLDELLDPFVRRQFKGIKKSLPIQRCNYIVALLLDNDVNAAEKACSQFEHLAYNAPWEADFEIDRELMAMALEIHESRNTGENDHDQESILQRP